MTTTQFIGFLFFCLMWVWPWIVGYAIWETLMKKELKIRKENKDATP